MPDASGGPVRLALAVPRSPLAARSFFRDPVGYVHTHGDEGSGVHLAAGPSRFFLVRDPETIWRVLVTEADSFRPGKWKRRARRFVGETLNTLHGEAHRRRRLLLQPALERRRIAAFAPAILARAEHAHAGWQDGARIRLRDALDRLALTAAGDVLLSTDLEPISADLADALSRVMAAVPRFTPPLPGTAGGRALAEVDEAVREIVAERRRSPRNDHDLVGVLLRNGLPERTVRGEVIAFLLAAVDEPPSALEAAWYLLGRHPGAEARFHAELDAYVGDHPPGPEDGTALPFVSAVLHETLRLFPPARHIDRCPVRDVRLGEAHIQAGSNVLLSPLVTHSERRLYDRASEFVPERWLETAPTTRSRGAYLPFGAGPHTCIGQPLAWSIMTSALATIGRRWRLRVDEAASPPGPRVARLVVTLERR
jgi:cytochrome P450